MAFISKICRRLLAAALLCLVSTELCACKYSVRDVGFVELAKSDYRLLIVCDKALPQNRVQHYRETLTAALVGTPMSCDVTYFEQLNAEDQQVLTKAGITGGTAMVLIAPDRRCLPLPLPGAKRDDPSSPMSDEQLWETTQAALKSPLRMRLLEQLLSCHSVVLVVAGADADANATALRFAHEAARNVGKQLDRLPKRIDLPPLVLSLDRATSAAEQVFLWSAGINSGDTDRAQLVVLYGRLRRMGPVRAVPGTTPREIEAQLALIGQDCECDLDRELLRGPMALHRWTGELASRAVDALGFDPGSPLIKAEITRILARGGRGVGGSAADYADTDPLLGYQEIALGDDALEPLQSLPAGNPSQTMDADTGPPPKFAAPPASGHADMGAAAPDSATSTWTPAAWMITLFMALAVATGSGILVHSWWRG